MKYVAFLRGIAPTNPKMSNKNLQKVFEDLGFKNVRTFISSGNVVFESASKNTAVMEKNIEATWPKKLGFTSLTFIRSETQLQRMIAKDPFKGKTHSKEFYLIVTFTKPSGEIYSVIRPDTRAGAKFMVDLEKAHGKEITTRTWKTVNRIYQLMQNNQ